MYQHAFKYMPLILSSLTCTGCSAAGCSQSCASVCIPTTAQVQTDGFPFQHKPRQKDLSCSMSLNIWLSFLAKARRMEEKKRKEKKRKEKKRKEKKRKGRKEGRKGGEGRGGEGRGGERRQDKTRQDKTRQDKTRQDKTFGRQFSDKPSYTGLPIQTHGLLFQQELKQFGEAYVFHKTLQERGF